MKNGTLFTMTKNIAIKYLKNSSEESSVPSGKRWSNLLFVLKRTKVGTISNRRRPDDQTNF